jgi:hypothetical protein
VLKGNKLGLIVFVWAAAVMGSACNCGTRLALNGTTKVTISDPADQQQFANSDTVTFTAHADNAAGLNTLALNVGQVQLKVCGDANTIVQNLDCSATFAANDPTYTSQIGGGKMVLTAIAIASTGLSTSASVTILIGTPAPTVWALNFVQPMPGTGFPPTATVSAPSQMQLAIIGNPPSPIISVVVVASGSNNVQIPIASYTSVPYQSQITWLTTPGVGYYTLTGTATAKTGETQSATVIITVNSPNCTKDTMCLQGSRCCLDDGQCHPIVGENQDCDCAHPCPTDEGCFPGTCGKAPQQCRPGCFPGTQAKKPDTCAPINGIQAYCEPLPPSQVTTQNKGGACAPGDGCDVVAQNCPDALLYPGQAAGANNPVVPYSCEPVAMNGNIEATVCFPAGTWPPQGNNTGNKCLGETDTCGSDTAGCVKGYECVYEQGNEAAGPACSQQCAHPVSLGFSCPPSTAGGCPSGQFCDGLLGNGNVAFTTGVCATLASIGCR